jgi:hypothetical protein
MYFIGVSFCWSFVFGTGGRSNGVAKEIQPHHASEVNRNAVVAQFRSTKRCH